MCQIWRAQVMTVGLDVDHMLLILSAYMKGVVQSLDAAGLTEWVFLAAAAIAENSQAKG